MLFRSCAYNEQLCKKKTVLQKKIKEQERAEATYSQYILKVQKTLSELNQLLDSCLRNESLSEAFENKAVYEKKLRLIKIQLSTIQSQIESAPDDTLNDYYKNYNQLRREYAELQKKISGWCLQFPEFCFFLEPFGN